MSCPPSARTAVDRNAATIAMQAFVDAIGAGRDPELQGTASRVASLFIDELCAGYATDTQALVREGVLCTENPSLVIVRDLPVSTTCPHHLLPAIGEATVAYLPRGKIVGFGTITSLVDAHARRLVLQEVLGEGIASDLHGVLSPEWVGVRIRLRHGCMLARELGRAGTSVETIAMRSPHGRHDEVYRALGAGSAR